MKILALLLSVFMARRGGGCRSPTLTRNLTIYYKKYIYCYSKASIVIVLICIKICFDVINIRIAFIIRQKITAFLET